MSLTRLASAFGIVAAAALSTACTVYPTIGRHGNIGLGVAPAPVYVQPAPVYVAPAPVYTPPAPVYIAPQPRYYAPYYAPSRPHRHRHW